MSYRKQLWWLPSYATVYLLCTPQRDHVIGIKDYHDNGLGYTFTFPRTVIHTLTGSTLSNKSLLENVTLLKSNMIYIFGLNMKPTPHDFCEINVVLLFCSGWRMIDYIVQPLKVKFGSAQLEWTIRVGIYNFPVKLKLILTKFNLINLCNAF